VPGNVTDFDLAVLGDCNADLLVCGDDVVPAFGQQERLVDEAKLTIGGSGGICASGAARLGLRVAMIGVLGDDVFGRFMRDALTERGVDVSAVRTDRQVPTGLTVHLVRGDDRAMLTNPGTIERLRPEIVDADLLASSRHVHVSSYFLQSGLWDGLSGLLGRARKAGATVSVDPNWDPSGTWDRGFSGIFGFLDFLLPNSAEATELARTTAGSSSDLASPEAAARVLTAAGATVAVKLGAEGALAAAPDGSLVRVPALRGVRPKDSVGAGDSFDAGFLAANLWGWDTRQALALGAACGALSTRASGGADAQPARDEAVAAAERLLADRD
jgi:sugar/nucleoside kinase (ribokinase family)